MAASTYGVLRVVDGCGIAEVTSENVYRQEYEERTHGASEEVVVKLGRDQSHNL